MKPKCCCLFSTVPLVSDRSQTTTIGLPNVSSEQHVKVRGAQLNMLWHTASFILICMCMETGEGMETMQKALIVLQLRHICRCMLRAKCS